MTKKLFVVLGLVVALTGCGNSEYDPESCALWTDLHSLTESGNARVEMDRYCTR